MFPRVCFTDPLAHLNSLCKALAYATTDEDGAVFMVPFLKMVAARRDLERQTAEAMRAVRDRLA
jgi:hypothetical protein